MATIRPVQTPSVQVAPLQVARQNVNVPTQRISNGVGEGLMNLGQSIEDINARVNETRVVQAETEFYRRVDDVLFNKDNGYYNSKGESAFNGVPDVTKRIEDIKKEFLDSLANDQQRNNFTLLADKRITNDRRNISVHASKELDVWDRAASDARIEQAMESATLDYSVQSITENVIRMEDEIHDQSNKQGVAPEVRNERLQTARSKLYASAIVNAANRFDIESARALQAKYGEFLEPDEKSLVDEKIMTIDRADKAMKIADKIRNEGGDRTTRNRKVNEIEGDAELRKMVKAQVISDYDQEEMAKSERQAAAFEDTADLALSGMSLTEIIRQNPAAYDSMSVAQQLKIRDLTDSMIPTGTDFDAYFELTGLIQNPATRGQAQKYFLDNVHLFDTEDRKFFAKAVQEPEKQQGLFDAQDYVQNELRDIKSPEQRRTLMREFDRWYLKQRNLNDGVDPDREQITRQFDDMMKDKGWGYDKNYIERAEQEPKAIQDGLGVYLEVFDGKEPDEADIKILQDEANRFYDAKGRWPKPSEWREKLKSFGVQSSE